MIKNLKNPKLFIVHCVDTEGPMHESLEATFGRLKTIFNIDLAASKDNLKKIQNQEIDLGVNTKRASDIFNQHNLTYNDSWDKIDLMLDKIMKKEYRSQFKDSHGNGNIYNWHCLDNVGFTTNQRRRDLGFGNIFVHYQKKIQEHASLDPIHWHFHPLSFTKDAHLSSTSYDNSYEILHQIICRRLVDHNWFPIVNRAGFHAIRQDSSFFLEQWIPFDYANQYYENENEDQKDLSDGRFGDWRRSSASWCGYHPSHEDYQEEGSCNRMIFRCLNIGTRFRVISLDHVRQAFKDAQNNSKAILSFANHDYRDMREDVINITSMINEVKKEFNDVKIKFSGAENAAIDLIYAQDKPTPKFETSINDNKFVVKLTSGELFGSQPFLAIKTKDSKYYHDNFDIITPRKVWSYTFDEQSFKLGDLLEVGAGSAGKYGSFYVDKIKFK